MTKPKKVKIDGVLYWFLDNGTGGGPIAPLEHCDDDGNLVQWDELGFAHVGPGGEVRRFRKKIGMLSDFIAAAEVDA